MKKIFTSVAIFLASCAAMAQAPSNTKLNYQGVCADVKGSEINVEFKVLKGGEEVYSETQTLMTNKDGVFTAKVGNNEAEWLAINWDGALYLQTLIDGKVVSTCDFAAVPYAKCAESYVGQEYIENDLQSAVEALRGKANVTDVTELQDQMEIVSGDLQGVQETLRGKANVSDVAALENLAQSLSEDIYKEGGLAEIIEGLMDAVDYATSDVQGIQESLRGKANVEDVAAIENLAQSLSEDIYKEGGLAEIIEGLQDAVDYATSDVQGIQESLRGKANVDEVAAIENLAQSLSEDIYKEGGLAEIIEGNMNAIDNVTSDVQGIQESLRGKANVADVNELKENVEILFSEEDGPIASVALGLTQLSNVVDKNAQDVTSLRETLFNEQTGHIPTIQKFFTNLNNLVYDNTEGVTELQEQMDNVSSDVQGMQESLRGKAKVEDVTELQDQMEIVSSDVQGVQETLRNKANVSDVTELQEYGENLRITLFTLINSLLESELDFDKSALIELMEQFNSTNPLNK